MCEYHQSRSWIPLAHILFCSKAKSSGFVVLDLLFRACVLRDSVIGMMASSELSLTSFIIAGSFASCCCCCRTSSLGFSGCQPHLTHSHLSRGTDHTRTISRRGHPLFSGSAALEAKPPPMKFIVGLRELWSRI